MQTKIFKLSKQLAVSCWIDWIAKDFRKICCWINKNPPSMLLPLKTTL